MDQRCDPLFGLSVLVGDRRHRKNNIWSVYTFVCLQAASNSDLAVHKGGAVLHGWSVKCVKALQCNIQRSNILNLATHSNSILCTSGQDKNTLCWLDNIGAIPDSCCMLSSRVINGFQLWGSTLSVAGTTGKWKVAGNELCVLFAIHCFFFVLSYLILSSVSISVSFVWFTVFVLVFLFLFL